MQRLVLAVGLMATATAAAKPHDDDLVDATTAIPDLVVQMRYATAGNFTGKPLYAVARCKLRRAVVERLARAAEALRAADRRLVVWDCYRPKSVQAEMWKRVPDPRYVASPATGSRHSRGAAVDVALADRDGKLVALPTAFDDFSTAAHRTRALAIEGDAGREARRLDAAMTAAGFVGLATEWWHFDASDADRFALDDEAL